MPGLMALIRISAPEFFGQGFGHRNPPPPWSRCKPNQSPARRNWRTELMLIIAAPAGPNADRFLRHENQARTFKLNVGE